MAEEVGLTWITAYPAFEERELLKEDYNIIIVLKKVEHA
jgi:hypothetical protein